MFNGLIRDQAKLFKIMDLQRHCRMVLPEKIKLHELTLRNEKIYKKMIIINKIYFVNGFVKLTPLCKLLCITGKNIQ